MEFSHTHCSFSIFIPITIHLHHPLVIITALFTLFIMIHCYFLSSTLFCSATHCQLQIIIMIINLLHLTLIIYFQNFFILHYLLQDASICIIIFCIYQRSLLLNIFTLQHTHYRFSLQNLHYRFHQCLYAYTLQVLDPSYHNSTKKNQ